MKKYLSSFLSGVAAIHRFFVEHATRARQQNDLALLRAGLLRPIQMHLDIASSLRAIDVELQDPKLREMYDSIELSSPSEASTDFSSANVLEMLDEIKKTCLRDGRFAERLAHARQEYSDELREIRRRLQSDLQLRETFRRNFNAHDALDALRILGSLAIPGEPAPHSLIHEADQLAAMFPASRTGNV